jgi:hypothetical protein
LIAKGDKIISCRNSISIKNFTGDSRKHDNKEQFTVRGAQVANIKKGELETMVIKVNKVCEFRFH